MYTLLVVDDEQLERQAIRFIIDRHCPEISIVGEASDGLLAVQVAARVQPDIIVMDIQMPKLSGLDAAKQICGQLPDTKMILVTAADNANYIKEAAQLGVAEYMLKPVRPDKLVRILHSISAQIVKLKKSVAL